MTPVRVFGVRHIKSQLFHLFPFDLVVATSQSNTFAKRQKKNIPFDSFVSTVKVSKAQKLQKLQILILTLVNRLQDKL